VDSLSTILKKIKAFGKNVQSFFYQIVKIVFSGLIRIFEKYIQKKQIDDRAEADKKLVFSMSKSRIPNFRQLKYIKKYLNSQEILIINVSIFVIVVSALVGGTSFYKKHIQLVAKQGGKYIEGSIGSPKYINPLYSSLSDTDSDIARLVYSSLYKLDKNGQLANDLVETQKMSDDQKVYSYKIREAVLWHDGQKLTVDDIIFTFNLIKDSQYKSPLRSSFNGVTIEKVDDYNFKFILSDPYAAFSELLTFGIMPAHVWENSTPESISLADANLHPIGSGPYESSQMIKDKAGNIKEYDLVVNKKYYNTKANVDISYKFFGSFEEVVGALNDNQVDGMSYLPHELKDNIITPNAYNFYQLYLPQLTAIFFNQINNSNLANKNIRKALAYSIDKQAIINDQLFGGAQVVDGPILPNNFAYYNQTDKYIFNPEAANTIFTNEKWAKVEITKAEINILAEKKKSESAGGANAIKLTAEEQAKLDMGAGKWLMKDGKYLKIKLTTVDTSENTKVVKTIKNYWEVAGVKTELEVLSPSQIQSDVIRGRNFEALFYGQVLGIDPDPYAFWHSSQTGAQGYNIANYSNKDVDQLLEDARKISNPEERKVKYYKFQEIISQEVPAIFVYSPSYTYVQVKKVKGFDVKSIITPRDRFANVEDWYIETKKKLVW